MAKQVSDTKEYIAARVPIENADMLRIEAQNFDGGMTEIVNEALFDWLKLHGYDPVENKDGRGGRWKLVVHSRVRIIEDGHDE
jgi:hypothetical protein